MSTVELSIQLQIDSIAAVKSAMVDAVAGRPDNTLWWLSDYSHDIAYQNRISGTELVAIDSKINNADVSTIFNSWFGMQNSYFSTDASIPNVSTLKQAIELFYRWRVPAYFNDIMRVASSDGLTPQYVFPNTDYVVGSYLATGSTTGTFTAGSGAVDLTKVGPGILVVRPTVTIGVADLLFTITAVYQDATTASIGVTVPAASETTDSVLIGEQAVTGVNSTTGVVLTASTTLFKVGQWVLLREDLTGTTDFYWKTEIAEVAAINSGVSVTLGQPRVTGVTTPVTVGLRNSFTTAARLYPLFKNISGVVSQATGTNNDAVVIGFDPDRPQGFIDISSISYPQ